MADFLLEIGLEEVPARMIAGAEAELGRRVNDLLTRERLLAAGSKLATYSTPRRLAVLVEGVLLGQADTEEQLTGPSWKVAFKDGAPTKAAEAFAAKAGVAVAALEKVVNPKGEYVGATVKRLGQKHVLARRQARALCPPRPLGRCPARLNHRSFGDCRHCRGQHEPRPSRTPRRNSCDH